MSPSTNPVQKETGQKPAKMTVEKRASPGLDPLVKKKLEESGQRVSEMHKKMWREVREREESMAREMFHIRTSQMLPNQASPPPPQHSVAWIANLVSSSSSSNNTLTSMSSLGSIPRSQ